MEYVDCVFCQQRVAASDCSPFIIAIKANIQAGKQTKKVALSKVVRNVCSSCHEEESGEYGYSHKRTFGIELDLESAFSKAQWSHFFLDHPGDVPRF